MEKNEGIERPREQHQFDTNEEAYDSSRGLLMSSTKLISKDNSTITMNDKTLTGQKERSNIKIETALKEKNQYYFQDYEENKNNLLHVESRATTPQVRERISPGLRQPADLNLKKQMSTDQVDIQALQIVGTAGGKNITVNADKNINIRELIANKDRQGAVNNGQNFLQLAFDSGNKANAPTRQAQGNVTMTIDSINDRDFRGEPGSGLHRNPRNLMDGAYTRPRLPSMDTKQMSKLHHQQPQMQWNNQLQYDTESDMHAVNPLFRTADNFHRP